MSIRPNTARSLPDPLALPSPAQAAVAPPWVVPSFLTPASVRFPDLPFSVLPPSLAARTPQSCRSGRACACDLRPYDSGPRRGPRVQCPVVGREMRFHVRAHRGWNIPKRTPRPTHSGLIGPGPAYFSVLRGAMGTATEAHGSPPDIRICCRQSCLQGAAGRTCSIKPESVPIPHSVSPLIPESPAPK